MKTIEELQESVDKYINELCSESDYSHLKIRISIYTSQKQKETISFRSNANVGLRKSLIADSKIINYVTSVFNDYQGSEKYIFQIHYSELNTKKDDKTNRHNSENELIADFYIEEPKYKLSSVVLPKPKWEEIYRALAMIKNYTKVYKDWGFDEIDPSSKTIICLYGKPGTGKTKCAHGIAEYLHKKILCASYADIQSQYVGVGPKNLRNIFKQAESEDAVLFFDEADAFLRKRSSDTSSSAAMHYNSMTNEMMKHLEDFNGIVIFATNLTENIDDAFMTRITSAVEFPVPDLETRIELIKTLIPTKVPLDVNFSDDDYYNIANKCEGFVGRDIRNAIKVTLSKAADNESEFLTPKDFEDGFDSYKRSKDCLNDNVKGSTNKESIYEQIQWNTANAAVLAICSYMAWIDGPETEEETSLLKKIAGQLNRDKVIITKLNDLPSLEELCEKIKIPKQKITTIDLAMGVLAISTSEEKSYEMLQTLCTNFELDNDYVSKAKELYQCHKSICSLEKTMVESVSV